MNSEAPLMGDGLWRGDRGGGVGGTGKPPIAERFRTAAIRDWRIDRR